MAHEHTHTKPPTNGTKWKYGINAAVVVTVLTMAGGALFNTGKAAEQIENLQQEQQVIKEYIDSNQKVVQSLQEGLAQLRAKDERDYDQVQRVLDSLESLNKRLNRYPVNGQ